MNDLRFEWDEAKNRRNKQKHGVEFYDDQHSEWEDRFLMLGQSFKQRMLCVSLSPRRWQRDSDHFSP